MQDAQEVDLGAEVLLGIRVQDVETAIDVLLTCIVDT
jgi:hypothetical protein